MSIIAGSSVRWLCLAAAVLSWSPSESPSAVAPTAAMGVAERATVFLRVVADVRPTRDQDAWLLKEAGLDQANVEVGVGSGFFFSPLGYILTNHHVVSDRELSVTIERRTVTLSIAVRRVDVLFSGGAEALPAQEAAVVASSADLDLAVLHIGGSSEYPFLPLGDSDALDPGQPVQVLGFPFGQQVEVGRPAGESGAAPQVSVSQGTVSAIRDDEQGQRRYLQTTATLNPGNSGGPMIDADGYVAGVISLALVRGKASTGVGFAIPVNLAKAFVEAQGLEGQLQTRRLSLGPLQSLEPKGLRLRLPDGMADTSPKRTAVDARSDLTPDLVLRIDRIVSSWTAQRLAETLTAGRAFESLLVGATTIYPVRGDASATAEARPPYRGRATGTLADGVTPARMEFGLVQIGRETLVARYVGPADVLAFNASILRASVASLAAEPLAVDRRTLSRPLAWVPALRAGEPTGAGVVMPDGWLQEEGAPLPCPGLVRPVDSWSASPVSDFTVALRAVTFPKSSLTPAQAAAACGTPGQADPGHYQRRVEEFGVPFVVTGAFIAGGAGALIQLEAVAPAERAGELGALLTEWVGRVRRP